MKEFMGDASHELRSPLTVIRGYVEILADQKQLSDEQRERAFYRLKVSLVECQRQLTTF